MLTRQAVRQAVIEVLKEAIKLLEAGEGFGTVLTCLSHAIYLIGSNYGVDQ